MCLLFTGLGLYVAAALPPYVAVDEQAHLGYAEALADGKLPEIETPLPTDDIPSFGRHVASQDEARHTVWTANHPPGGYVVAAPIAAGLNLFDRGEAMPGVMRGLNVLGGVAMLLATYALTREVTDGDIGTSLFATLLVAVTPGVLTSLSFGMTDGIATAVVIVAMWAGARFIRDQNDRTAGVLGAALTAAGLVRLTSILLAALFVVVLLAFEVLARRRPSWRSLGLIWAPPVVLTSWFWLRNRILYGDVAGSAVLLDKFDRSPGQPISVNAFYVNYLRNRLLDLFGGTTDIGPRLYGNRFLPIILWAVLASLVLFVVRTWRRRAVVEERPALRREVSIVVAALAVVPGSWYLLLRHVASGGSPHARYLMVIIPVAALIVALGTRALPTVARLAARVAMVAGLGWLLYDRVSHVEFLSFFLVKDPGFPNLLQPVGGPGARGLFVFLAGVGALLAGLSMLQLLDPASTAPEPDGSAPKADAEDQRRRLPS